MANNRTEEQVAFDNLVTDLIEEIDATNFNGALLEGLESQTPNFWKYLINYMYHEYENQYLGHAPIQERDFSGAPSFVEYLNQYIDLDNDKNRNVKWSTIWKSIKSNATYDKKSTWNESLGKIIKCFVNAFDVNGRIYISGEEGNGVYISIEDIMHANAGNKFEGNYSKNDWILPNINVDGEAYGEVRENDKIISVLNNDKDLQFTNPVNPPGYYNNEEMKNLLAEAARAALNIFTKYDTAYSSWDEILDGDMTDELLMILNYWNVSLDQYRRGFSDSTVFPSEALYQFLLAYSEIYPEKPDMPQFEEYAPIHNFYTENKSSWLRLLMPKYVRRVEVEDLNRNFWVLCQTTSALCTFLFGPEAPFAKLFEDMAAEITQLWENILYLWLAYAMSTQKKEITDVHVEVVYLPNSVYEPYLKFDDFDMESITFNNNFWNDVKDRCRYIVTQHSDSHVIILPKIRWKNYKHNYYEKEVWPGILWFNRTTNDFTYSMFKTVKQADDYTSENDHWVQESDGLIIDAASLQHYELCWSVKEDEFNYYLLPADYVFDHSGYENEPYYTLLRTNQACNFVYNTVSKKLAASSLTITTQDIGTLFLSPIESSATIDTYIPATGFNQNTAIIGIKHTVKPYREAYPYPDPPPLPYEFPIKNLEAVHRGAYYQGEFPSWLIAWDATPEPPPEPEPDPTLYQIDFQEIQLNPSAFVFVDISKIYGEINNAYNNGQQTPNVLEDFRYAYGNRMTAGYYMDNEHNYEDYNVTYDDPDHPFKMDFVIPNNDFGLPTYEQRTGNWGRQTNDGGGVDMNDHSGTDVGHSYFTWEASNIISSLTRKQYLINELTEDPDRYISGDTYTLYKYVKSDPPVQDVGAFCLIVGTHQIQLWRHVWNPNYVPFGSEHISAVRNNYTTYFINENNNLDSITWQYDTSAPQDNRADYPAAQYYPHNAFAISNSALLHRYANQSLGLLEKDIIYDSFYSEMYGPSGYLHYYYGDYYHFEKTDYTYYLIKKSDNNVLMEDNWICMHVRVSGGHWTYEGDDVIQAYTTDRFPKEIAGEIRNTIITSISIYFFFPDGRCVYATLDRYKDHGFKEVTRSSLPQDLNYYLTHWHLKFFGDFENGTTTNREVFLKLYNKQNYTSDNLRDSDYTLFGSIPGNKTIHEFDNVEYCFSPYDDSDIFDPILYPNTLIKNAEQTVRFENTEFIES